LKIQRARKTALFLKENCKAAIITGAKWKNRAGGTRWSERVHQGVSIKRGRPSFRVKGLPSNALKGLERRLKSSKMGRKFGACGERDADQADKGGLERIVITRGVAKSLRSGRGVSTGKKPPSFRVKGDLMENVGFVPRFDE